MKYNKEINFGETGKDRLIQGVNTLANSVTSTLGASGRTVIIEDMYGGASVTKDGVSVARAITLKDNVQNIGCTILKESAEKTVAHCGDGTTTTILLSQFLVNEGEKLIQKGYKPFELKKGVETAVEAVIKELESLSIEVTDKKLKDVATVSANNDEVLGEIISDAFISAGDNGVVTVEESKTEKTHTVSVKGLEVLRGYDNRYFVTDEKKEIALLDNPLILLVDSRINTPSEIVPYLEHISSNNRPLLIVSEMDEEVLGALLLNKVKGGLKVCSIKPPSFGLKRKELMADLAIATGATLIDDLVGDNFENFDLSFLGESKKVIVSKGTTTIIVSDEVEAPIDIQIKVLKSLYDEQESDEDKEFITKRIAKLAGKVSVIHVGGRTDIERNEIKDRVEDAVSATKSALEEGISSGGGIAMYDISFTEIVDIKKNKDFNAGIQLVRYMLMQPLNKILKNAGLDISEIKTNIVNRGSGGYGYDVKNDVYGNMMKLGIIDPTKVLKHSLRNAVSVAMTILTTDCIITNIKE